MLQANNLAKTYVSGGRAALEGLDLTVNPGEIHCLLGANGAGKRTTINLFLGFLQPTSGSVHVNGVDVTANPMGARHQLAYIPEQVALYPNLTGRENLEFFTQLAADVTKGSTDYDGLLARVGLSSEASARKTSTYSKGMRQKIGIAMAIARNSKALLLDEPTSGLDPYASNSFSGLLEGLAGEGVAILMATHDLFRARGTGTHLSIMREGRMLETLKADDASHGELEDVYLQLMASSL